MVTVFFNGKRYEYYFNGSLYRTSKLLFKYACVATSNETGNSFVISLGNKVQNTLNSMSRFYRHYCDLDVQRINEI